MSMKLTVRMCVAVAVMAFIRRHHFTGCSRNETDAKLKISFDAECDGFQNFMYQNLVDEK